MCSKRKRKKKLRLLSCHAQTVCIVLPTLTCSTVIKSIQNSINYTINCVFTLHSLFTLFQPPHACHHRKHGLLGIEWLYILSCIFCVWRVNLQSHIVAEWAACLLAATWCQSVWILLTLFSWCASEAAGEQGDRDHRSLDEQPAIQNGKSCLQDLKGKPR